MLGTNNATYVTFDVALAAALLAVQCAVADDSSHPGVGGVRAVLGDNRFWAAAGTRVALNNGEIAGATLMVKAALEGVDVTLFAAVASCISMPDRLDTVDHLLAPHHALVALLVAQDKPLRLADPRAGVAELAMPR